MSKKTKRKVKAGENRSGRLRESMGKKKPKKVSKKVRKPCDRTGAPITVGDVLEWEDGTRMRVDVLEWCGGDWWCATDCSQDDYSDNLGASVIVARKAVER